MSFAESVAYAISEARYPQLSEISRAVWSAWSSGVLDDDQAQALAAALHEKRGPLPHHLAARNNAPCGFLRARVRPPQRSPDRIRSLQRRRRLAASGAVPSALAEDLTLGQVAALAVIGGEIRKHGRCVLPIDAIAAIAGISRTLVKVAVRKAIAARMICREERRRRGQASLTNVLRAFAQWWAWLRRKIAGRFTPSTTTSFESEGLNRHDRRALAAVERRSRRESG